MTSASQVLQRYADVPKEDTTSVEFYSNVLSYKADWSSYEVTAPHAPVLSMLDAFAAASKQKAIFLGNSSVLQACMAALGVREDRPVQFVLTLLVDIVRSDSSCYQVFEVGMEGGCPVHAALLAVIERPKLDSYIADKAAWLLTAVVAHTPQRFNEKDVLEIGRVVLKAPSQAISEVGVLEAMTNLLKNDCFRRLVWAQPGVAERFFAVNPIPGRWPQPVQSSSSQLYRFVFAIWLLSFDDEAGDLRKHNIVKKIKDILVHCRTEKVVRMVITVLKNLLCQKALAEDIVEENILESVQVLEYEKWRDAELYDDIRDMTSRITHEVNELSNFDRYMREIETGKMHWGFIHSSKFWAENVMKFDHNDFRAVKMLVGILGNQQTDPETAAVACRDLGEFVTLHPLGKKKAAQYFAKERVMNLMSSREPEKRDVRREALLCCQKIMLNRWQDAEKAQK